MRGGSGINPRRRSIIAGALVRRCGRACSRTGQRRGEESRGLPVQGRRSREAHHRRGEKRARGRRLHFVEPEGLGPIVEVFERKYGVKVQLWRSSSEKVLQRAVAEARAGRFSCDIWNQRPGDGSDAPRGAARGVLQPALQGSPAGGLSRHRHYVADRFNFFTIAYNTNLVKANEVPNTYEDLLNRASRAESGSRRATSTGSAPWSSRWARRRGSHSFRKLAAANRNTQRPHADGRARRLGRDPLAATIYNHNADAWW